MGAPTTSLLDPSDGRALFASTLGTVFSVVYSSINQFSLRNRLLTTLAIETLSAIGAFATDQRLSTLNNKLARIIPVAMVGGVSMVFFACVHALVYPLPDDCLPSNNNLSAGS